MFANTAPSLEDFFLQSATPKPNKKNTYSAKKSCTPSKVRAGVSHSSRMEKSVRIYIYGQREKQPVSIIRQLCELTCSNVSENNSMPPPKKLQGVPMTNHLVCGVLTKVVSEHENVHTREFILSAGRHRLQKRINHVIRSRMNGTQEIFVVTTESDKFWQEM